jgi:hypothetical protein
MLPKMSVNQQLNKGFGFIAPNLLLLSGFHS